MSLLTFNQQCWST